MRATEIIISPDKSESMPPRELLRSTVVHFPQWAIAFIVTARLSSGSSSSGRIIGWQAVIDRDAE